MHTSSSSNTVIDRWLLQALIAGMSVSLLLPFAQAQSTTLGWLPLWLTGLPLAAWLGWHGLNRVGTMSAAGTSVARDRRRIAHLSSRGRRGIRTSTMATRRPHARA